MSSPVNTPLTLLERAKVAAAVGATVTVPGDAFLDLCMAADVTGDIRGNIDRARTEVQGILMDAQAQRREAYAILDRAEATFARAKRTLGLSIVFAGLGIGTLIAGLIL